MTENPEVEPMPSPLPRPARRAMTTPAPAGAQRIRVPLCGATLPALARATPIPRDDKSALTVSANDNGNRHQCAHGWPGWLSLLRIRTLFGIRLNRRAPPATAECVTSSFMSEWPW